MLTVLGVVVGLVLLLYGRRLYWLLVAAIGFLTGLALAPRFLAGQPEWVILAAALLLALVGTVLAVVAQKLAIAVIGFLAGGAAGVLLLRILGIRGDLLVWIVYLIAGVVGLILVLGLFEWGLILISSLAGAILIVEGAEKSIPLSQGLACAVIIGVALIGVLVQASWVGASPRHRRPGARS
jgi:hypothetical protein